MANIVLNGPFSSILIPHSAPASDLIRAYNTLQEEARLAQLLLPPEEDRDQ